MKYGSVRTWSELVGRWFASKLEATRGEELHFLQMAGEIADLQYQVPFVLSKKPSVKVVIDFQYTEATDIHDLGGLAFRRHVYEDAKGVLTATARVKYAWLKQKHGIDVVLWRG